MTEYFISLSFFPPLIYSNRGCDITASLCYLYLSSHAIFFFLALYSFTHIIIHSSIHVCLCAWVSVCVFVSSSLRWVLPFPHFFPSSLIFIWRDSFFPQAMDCCLESCNQNEKKRRGKGRKRRGSQKIRVLALTLFTREELHQGPRGRVKSPSIHGCYMNWSSSLQTADTKENIPRSGFYKIPTVSPFHLGF